MSSPSPAAFDFGENWSEFSAHALTPDRVAQARKDFAGLLAGVPMAGRSFLDIGFGQGLGLLTAATLGAEVIGCDLNPKCAEVLLRNHRLFPELTAAPPTIVGSILADDVVARLRRTAPPAGFDIVHSWGVLHHTGNMSLAIRNAASLVAPGGHFVIAIYNRHWSSRPWWWIKRLYVGSPAWVQRSLVAALLPVIYLAKWLVTGKNPTRQERGMDFRYDVVDWVGGFPYEYASAPETIREVSGLGFSCVRQIPANVPTGCNQFIFVRQT